MDRIDLTASFEAQGVTHSGTVVRMAESSIVVAFEGSLVRALALPIEASITFSGGRLCAEFSAQGSVRQWSREADKDRLLIDITDEQFAIIESAAFPQRSARTAVRGSKAIRVVVQSMQGEAEISAALVDLSESGVAIIAATADDQALAELEENEEQAGPWLVRLNFKLPGNETELMVVGEICYRMFTHKCIKYGIRFNLEATREVFSEAESNVHAHIERFRKDIPKAA